jgi:hypothetical protein
MIAALLFIISIAIFGIRSYAEDAKAGPPYAQHLPGFYRAKH